MKSIEEIMSDIEQFENNIKEIALVLEALNKINEDYEESLNAPRKVITKLEETNAAQAKEFQNITQELQNLLTIVKEYDVLIEDSINRGIDTNLSTISNANEQILEEMKRVIDTYELNKKQHEAFLSDNLTELEQQQADVKSFLNSYKTSFESSTKEFYDELGHYVERFKNEIKKSTDNYNLNKKQHEAFISTNLTDLRQWQSETQSLLMSYREFLQNLTSEFLIRIENHVKQINDFNIDTLARQIGDVKVTCEKMENNFNHRFEDLNRNLETKIQEIQKNYNRNFIMVGILFLIIVVMIVVK